LKTFIAVHGKHKYSHSLMGCCKWANSQSELHPNDVIKIHSARAGDKYMRVIAEVFDGKFRLISNGRKTPTIKKWGK